MTVTASVAASPLPFRRFGPILAVHFLGTLGFSLAIPFLVYIVRDLGGASWTYGLVGATYSACQFVGAPLLGRWSDRAGRRPVLVASQVGTLAAWGLFLVALSVPVSVLGAFAGATLTLPLLLVFAARALDGATGGNISVANAYVADLTRDHGEVRQVAFGRMGMAASLGFAIGPAVAGLLGGTVWGPRLPIALAALLALVTTVAIFLLLDEPKGRCPNGPPPPSSTESGLGQQAKPCHGEEAPRGQAVWRQPAVARALVATFLLFLAFNFFFAGFPVHAVEVFGWDPSELGFFFGVLALVMMAAQGPLLGAASRRLPGTVVFALGIALLVAAMFTFELPAGPVSYLGAVFYAAGNGLSWPTFQARVAELGGEAQGAVQGAVTSAASLASIVGLVAGGALYPAVGAGLFTVAAALFAIVLLGTRLWFPRER
ncbi:MAG: MFS transporter [Myxococcota bacterium]